MRGIPSRALGSRSLRDRLSTRQIAENRSNVRRTTNIRSSGPAKNGAHSSGLAEERPTASRTTSTRNLSSRSGESSKKPNLPLKPKTGLLGKSPRGNDYRLPSRSDNRRLETKNVFKRLRGPIREGVRSRSNEPRDTKYFRGNRREPRDFDRGEHPAQLSEGTGRPIHSTKDLLFKGPKKARNYREEDLKKFKVDIRPSLSENQLDRRNSDMFDRDELKKFKIDIKGENFDSHGGDITYRDTKGNPYSKKDLESVRIQIQRKMEQEDRQDDGHSHSIKRNLDLNKFSLPQYPGMRLLNSRDNFSSLRQDHQEKRDLSAVKVNIVRQVSNPTNEPVRRDFSQDSFQMYRRTGG